jgi:hypothetical protein
MREAEIKRALASHLVDSGLSEQMAFLQEVELHGGQVRADLVDVPEMHCYEIKSEGDSLVRLIGQGARYALVFDRITLVTAERHLKKALLVLPPWWGVMIVPPVNGLAFKQLRAAQPNKMHEPAMLATLLNRAECLHLLESMGRVRGWRSKSLYQLQGCLAGALTLDELKCCVRSYLLARLEAPVSRSYNSPLFA